MCTQQVPHQMNHFPMPSCIFISKKKDLRVLEAKYVKQGHQASSARSEHTCHVLIFSTELSRSHCFFCAYEYRMFLLFQSPFLITLANPCLSGKMMPPQVSEVKIRMPLKSVFCWPSVVNSPVLAGNAGTGTQVSPDGFSCFAVI